MLHLENEIELNKSTGDGFTQRTHLEAAARVGSKTAIQQLYGCPKPACLDYLVEWYNELNLTRGMGQFGPDPITHEQIRAWATNMDIQPKPHEIKALTRIDLALRLPKD